MKNTGLKIGAGIVGGFLVISMMNIFTISNTVSMLGTTYQSTANSSSDSTKTASCTTDDDTPGTSIDVHETDVVKKVATMFANKNYSRASTAGVLGNLYAESGLDPTAASADNGYGIAQWTPREKIRAWLDSNGHSDLSDSDVNGQALMLSETVASGFNTHYVEAVKELGYAVPDNDLYRMWTEASDAETAAIAFMGGYERPNWSLRRDKERVDAAKKYYDMIGSITFKVADGTTSSGSSSDSGSTESSSTATATSCTSSDAEYGSVGNVPEGQHDFGWMCDWGGICKDGDGLDGEGNTRNFYHANVARYQCVWYAWNRLAMIHGSDGWSFLSGNGGEIHIKAASASAPGWEVSDTPQPGDGVSQFGGALGGTTKYGHVAVVEKVEKTDSGWKILISEGNYNTDGSGPWNGFNTRWLTSEQFTDAGQVFFRYSGWEK